MDIVAQLTERITIKVLSTTKQPNGEVTEQWSDLATVWADAIPLSGKENYSSDQNAPSQSYRFLIRHRTDIDTTNKIVWAGKEFDIHSINPYFKAGMNKITEIKGEWHDGR